MPDFGSGAGKAKVIRIKVGMTIIFLIALIHIFRVEKFLHESYHGLYSSYASDVSIPFGFYFLFCVSEFDLKFFKTWWSKALLLFLLITGAEFLQKLGFYAFGITFDWWDIFAYFVGISLAVLLERLGFSRIFPNWDY